MSWAQVWHVWEDPDHGRCNNTNDPCIVHASRKIFPKTVKGGGGAGHLSIPHLPSVFFWWQGGGGLGHKGDTSKANTHTLDGATQILTYRQYM